MIKPFQWSKKKDKTGYVNLGKIIFNDFNVSNQIGIFGVKILKAVIWLWEDIKTILSKSLISK